MTRKVSADAVRLIRRYARSGYGPSELSEAFGLSRQAVSRIINRRTHTKIIDTPKLEPLAEVERDDHRRTPKGERVRKSGELSPKFALAARQLARRAEARAPEQPDPISESAAVPAIEHTDPPAIDESAEVPAIEHTGPARHR